MKLTRTPEAILDGLARWATAAEQSELGPCDPDLARDLCLLLDGIEAGPSDQRGPTGEIIITYWDPTSAQATPVDQMEIFDTAYRYIVALREDLRDRPALDKEAVLLADEADELVDVVVDLVEAWSGEEVE